LCAFYCQICRVCCMWDLCIYLLICSYAYFFYFIRFFSCSCTICAEQHAKYTYLKRDMDVLKDMLERLHIWGDKRWWKGNSKLSTLDREHISKTLPWTWTYMLDFWYSMKFWIYLFELCKYIEPSSHLVVSQTRCFLFNNKFKFQILFYPFYCHFFDFGARWLVLVINVVFAINAFLTINVVTNISLAGFLWVDSCQNPARRPQFVPYVHLVCLSCIKIMVHYLVDIIFFTLFHNLGVV
jgi:hypothetical protein